MLLDNGVVEQDPDGKLWLSEKMTELVEDLKNDEVVKKIIQDNAKDDEDFLKGCWVVLYTKFMGPGGVTRDELGQAVRALLGWNKAVSLSQLDEWSMKLRLH